MFYFSICSPGTAPRCLRMDPELFGSTVRFHPCLRERTNNYLPHYALNITSVSNTGSTHSRRSPRSPESPATYFEKGSDFPVGKPLPCVLVSTFPQCTATWLSLCSTVLQYSCCEEVKGGRRKRRRIRPGGAQRVSQL